MMLVFQIAALGNGFGVENQREARALGPYIVSSRFLIPAWLVVLDVFNVSIPFFPFHMDLSTIPLDVLQSVVCIFFFKENREAKICLMFGGSLHQSCDYVPVQKL